MTEKQSTRRGFLAALGITAVAAPVAAIAPHVPDEEALVPEILPKARDPLSWRHSKPDAFWVQDDRTGQILESYQFSRKLDEDEEDDLKVFLEEKWGSSGWQHTPQTRWRKALPEGPVVVREGQVVRMLDE